MTYRGVPFLVTERAGSSGTEPPRASGRPLLPRRLSGIRFSTSARRSLQGRALPFVPEGASAPVAPASSGRSENAAPRLADIDPRTLFLGLLALLAIAVVSALVGTAIARFAFGYVERANSPFATSQQAVNLSTPQSAWEKGAAPQLYQTDPQWAERPYGASTLGALGAAPTCLAMAHVALSGDATIGPVEAAAYAQNNGLAQEDATPLLTDGAAGLGLSAKAVEPDEMALRSELNRGRPVICATAPGTFDEATSYIVLVRIDEHSRLVIRDPLSSERTEQHWSFEDILGNSVGLWSYTLAQ